MTKNTEPLTSEQAIAQIEDAESSEPSPLRVFAENLIRSGEVNDETTFADAKALLEAQYVVKSCTVGRSSIASPN